MSALVDNPELGVTWDGPAKVSVHTFQCRDGDVALYLRAVFEKLPDEKIGVVTCGTIEF